MPTVSTVAGIETDVRPRFLNAPWSMVRSPVAGKLTLVTNRLLVSVLNVNALLFI